MTPLRSFGVRSPAWSGRRRRLGCAALVLVTGCTGRCGGGPGTPPSGADAETEGVRGDAAARAVTATPLGADAGEGGSRGDGGAGVDAGGLPSDAGGTSSDAGVRAVDAGPALPPPPTDVLIPAGPVWLGCLPDDADCADDERPGRERTLDAFSIDLREVTVDDYAACVRRGACNDDHTSGYAWPGQPFTATALCNYGQPGRGRHPMNCVDWTQADAYCRAVGRRLPTEAEWEKAARGGDRRRWPWGAEAPACERVVWGDGPGPDGCGGNGTAPVGSRPAEGYGLFDLGGNVEEWVADAYDSAGGAAGVAVHAAAPTGAGGPASNERDRRVHRGGGWSTERPAWLRVSARFASAPVERRTSLGFRCAGP